MTILQQRPDELIAILRPEFMSSPGLPGGDGGWLNKIYHIPSSTDPLGVYEKTDTGLDQASAAASAGDVIYIPACTLTANHALKDLVEYWGAGRDMTILTGEIGIGTAIINNMSITRTANDADILRAIVGPLSGIGKLYNCNVSVAQAGAGEAGNIDIVGSGSVYAFGCNFTSSSVGGDSYVGIRALGETGEIKLWDCQIDAGTKGFKEYEFTGAGWVWEAPGISISVVKPAFGVGDGYSAWSAVYNPPADAQAFVYRHQRTGGVSNEWSHTDYSPDGGATDHVINADQNPVDKILYFRKLGYDPGVDAQVFAKYPAAIWKGNADVAVLGPNQVVRAGWSSGFGIDVTYTVTAYMLDVLRFAAAGSYNWTDAADGFYVYSVQGDYDICIIGSEPMEGEAGAWNTENYPTRHGRDIYANFIGVNQYHNNPADPFLKTSSSHDPVTLAADADGLLGLSGQELSLDSQDANKFLAGPTSGAAADPTFRLVTNADLPNPLALLASSILTISVGAVTASKSYHIIAAETGATDDLVTINGGTDRQFLMIQSDAGDTITVKHGTGNVYLNGAADFSLSGDKTLLLFYDGTNWSDVGAGGGGGVDTFLDLNDTPASYSGQAAKYLKVNSGETAIEFGTGSTGGDFTQISETVVGAGGAASVTFSSIPSTYRHLMLVIQGRSERATTGDSLDLRFNGDSSAVYDQQAHVSFGGSTAIFDQIDQTLGWIGDVPGANSPAGQAGQMTVMINNYKGTTFHKSYYSQVSGRLTTGTGNLRLTNISGFWRDTSAISSIAVIGRNADIAEGTVLTLYGLS